MQIKASLTIKPKDFYMRASLRSGMTPTTLQQSLTSPTSELKVSNSQGERNSKDFRPSRSKLTVLYGSNTGTCQALAQKLSSDARLHGYEASVSDLDAAMDNIPKDRPVLIITASYEGQPTDNAAYFFAWLQSMKDDKALDGVNFAIFGCGHSKSHLTHYFLERRRPIDWENTTPVCKALVFR